MKIGVKTFDNPNFLRAFVDKADFFEIMAIEGKDYSFLDEFNKPIIIHAQHEGFNINIADKTKKEKSLKSINFAIILANKYNASKIILHPGNVFDENCSEEEAISFLKSIKDKRIIIENLINLNWKIAITPESIERLKKKTGKGFCFDFNHAIVTALELKEDPYEFVKKFIKLKLDFYHIGGQNMKDLEKGTHLSFRDPKSDIDVKKLMQLLPKDAQITIETTKNIDDVMHDLNLLRKLTS